MTASQTARLGLHPPDPCVVQVSWIGPDGATLSQTTASLAADQLQTFDFALPPAIAAMPRTEIRPVVQPVEGQRACSGLISSLQVFDTATGVPAAVYLPQN